MLLHRSYLAIYVLVCKFYKERQVLLADGVFLSALVFCRMFKGELCGYFVSLL